MTTTKNPSVK